MRRLKQQLERIASPRNASGDDSTAWLDDRTPAYRIHSPAVSSVRIDTMPPGAGALGIDESAPRKRKRETSADTPVGVGVRHIDCDAYYDLQLATPQARTSSPQPTSDGEGVAKRVKLEPSDALAGSDRGEVEAAWTRIYASTPAQLSRLADGPVATMAAMKVGVPLVVRQLALHPHTRSPAHLLHAAVVSSVGKSDIEVQITDPFLDDDTQLPDSPPQVAVWTQSNFPTACHI